MYLRLLKMFIYFVPFFFTQIMSLGKCLYYLLYVYRCIPRLFELKRAEKSYFNFRGYCRKKTPNSICKQIAAIFGMLKIRQMISRPFTSMFWSRTLKYIRVRGDNRLFITLFTKVLS